MLVVEERRDRLDRSVDLVRGSSIVATISSDSVSMTVVVSLSLSTAATLRVGSATRSGLRPRRRRGRDLVDELRRLRVPHLDDVRRRSVRGTASARRRRARATRTGRSDRTGGSRGSARSTAAPTGARNGWWGRRSERSPHVRAAARARDPRSGRSPTRPRAVSCRPPGAGPRRGHARTGLRRRCRRRVVAGRTASTAATRAMTSSTLIAVTAPRASRRPRRARRRASCR